MVKIGVKHDEEIKEDIPSIEDFFEMKAAECFDQAKDWKNICGSMLKDLILISEPIVIKKLMISAAKELIEMHVKAALNSAIENGKLRVGPHSHKKGYPHLMVNQNPNSLEGEDYFTINPKSILNCYPPENIK